ncbi:hypothetical protein [Janthinobacterium sp. RB2R34]|uniref:hypothetical protein n=1 Tax=Janthinobacterium sp. RB2R34 TaxID=3424193 RepID=UPI003F24350D
MNTPPDDTASAAEWQAFEAVHQFEDSVFRLASASLTLLAESEFKGQVFSAFAFNAVSFPTLSLSFDTRPDNKELEYYPPDWSNECMEVDVPAIGQLWEQGYGKIAEALDELMARVDDDALDAIDAAYMHSLRKVLVRLETSGAFAGIRTTGRFWTLVTQVDADTDEEERLLGEVRLAATGTAQFGG